jgi:hypothetical protein
MVMSAAKAQQEVPPKVTILAAQHDLGALINQRSNGNPFKGALMALVGGVVAFLLSCGLFSLAAQVWRPIVWIAILALALGLCAIGWSVVALVRGSQAIYVYQGGVVYVRNGNARAAAWAEVREVEVQVIREGNLFAGKTSAYLVKPVNQAPMRVNSMDVVLSEGEQDPIGALLMRIASDAGRPVTRKLVGTK